MKEKLYTRTEAVNPIDAKVLSIPSTKVDDNVFWFYHQDIYPSYFDIDGYYKKEIIEELHNKYMASNKSYAESEHYSKKKANEVRYVGYQWFEFDDVMFSTTISRSKDDKVYVAGRIYYDGKKYNSDALKGLYNFILPFKKELTERNSAVWILVKGPNGALDFREFEIKSEDINLEINYGTKFLETHDDILNKLSSNKYKKGIGFFRGDPGTGKTTYIKYLISELVKLDKDIIYLPNSLAASLANPDMLTKLIEFPDAVLVIEDAESIISSRDDGGVNVEQILNISDGIFSDILGLQTICTYNTDKSNVDSALMRKGRMLFDYEFKKLNVDESNKLLEHIGIKATVDKESTLADLYNLEEKDYKKVKKKLGFGN